MRNWLLLLMHGSGSNEKVATLVGRSRAGDRQACEQLMAAYRPYLRLVAGQRLPRLLEKRADASDIVQQTLIDAMRGLPDFRGRSEAEFTAWMTRLLERNLLQIARLNMAAIRDVRREVREQGSGGSAQLVWHTLAGEGPTVQSSIFRGEAALLLAQALETLPDDQREAVRLRYLAQQSLDEIARQMNKTAAAVAGLIRRGVEKLRQQLPDELGES